MRKNQAAQSIALAFGLVGGLGFLGYTMLGDMLVSDPSRNEQVASAPVAKKEIKAAPAAVSVAPAVAVAAAAAVMAPAAHTFRTAETPMVPAAAPSSHVAQPQPAQLQPAQHYAAQGYAAPVIPAPVMPAAAPVQAAVPAPAPTSQTARSGIIRHVVMAPPPAPVQPFADPQPVAAPSAVEPAPKREWRRRKAKEPRVNVARPAPAAAKITQPRYVEPAMPARAAFVQAAAPAPAPVAAMPAVQAAERKPAVRAAATAAFTSKEDMAVTISGQKAWVQVSPTRTMEAKKGDVLPNLGRILEIRGNQVVAEKGTLTTN